MVCILFGGFILISTRKLMLCRPVLLALGSPAIVPILMKQPWRILGNHITHNPIFSIYVQGKTSTTKHEYVTGHAVTALNYLRIVFETRSFPWPNSCDNFNLNYNQQARFSSGNGPSLGWCLLNPHLQRIYRLEINPTRPYREPIMQLLFDWSISSIWWVTF